MIEFVLLVVEQFLCNRLETVEWIKKSGINCLNFSVPVLLMRSIMIPCVLSVNWGLDFDILNEKMSRLDITSQLPRAFRDALRPRRRGYIQFVSAVATAFKIVADPLVIVVSGDINRNFPYPDAVVLDLRSFSCRADIMTTLFPRSTAVLDGQPTTVETNVTEPSSVVTPPVVTNKDKNAAVESSEMASKTASSSSSVNGNVNLLINWDFIGEISKALESYTNRNDENLKSLFLGKKVDLKGHIGSITDALECLIEQRSHSGEEKEFPFDASRLVDDFRTLMSLLHTSEYDSKALAEIGELLKSMEARRPQLEALTSLLVGKNDDSVVVDSEEKGDDKNSDINVEDEDDSETEDSTAVEAEPNPSNKGKGKNEKKSNSKKGNSAAEEVETNPSKKGKGNNRNKNKPKKGKGGKKKR